MADHLENHDENVRIDLLELRTGGLEIVNFKSAMIPYERWEIVCACHMLLIVSMWKRPMIRS
jgi:hypothetical protein